MAIPKNLVYIFICAIVGAFLGMAYIVYFDIDINKFNIQFNYKKVDAKVHPLYLHLQKTLPALPNEVPVLSKMDKKSFYSNYISESFPVLVKGASADWEITKTDKK